MVEISGIVHTQHVLLDGAPRQNKAKNTLRQSSGSRADVEQPREKLSAEPKPMKVTLHSAKPVIQPRFRRGQRAIHDARDLLETESEVFL